MSHEFQNYKDKYEGTFLDFKEDLSKAFAFVEKKRKERGHQEYKDMYVFRAVDLFDLGSDDPLDNVYTHGLPFIIFNPTVCSSSIHLTVAMNFHKGSPCCLMRILVPWNYNDFLVPETVTEYKSEREVMFPVGSEFVVTKRTYIRGEVGEQILLLDCFVRKGAGGVRGGFVDLNVVRTGGCFACGIKPTKQGEQQHQHGPKELVATALAVQHASQF